MLECGLRAVVLHNKEVVWNYYAEFTADCRRINTKAKNTEDKVPVISCGEPSTTAKTKIPITKSNGILFLAHRGDNEITTNGAIYMVKGKGIRTVTVIRQSKNFAVEPGDGCVYVTSLSAYWAYLCVAQ